MSSLKMYNEILLQLSPVSPILLNILLRKKIMYVFNQDKKKRKKRVGAHTEQTIFKKRLV